MAEGLAQKAAKGFRLLNNAKKNGVKSTGFDWIKDYVELPEIDGTLIGSASTQKEILIPLMEVVNEILSTK